MRNASFVDVLLPKVGWSAGDSLKRPQLQRVTSCTLIKNHGSLNNWSRTLTKEVKLQLRVKGRTEMRCRLLKKVVAYITDIFRFQLRIHRIQMSSRTKWKQWVDLDLWFQNPDLDGHDPARKPRVDYSPLEPGSDVSDLTVALNIHISFKAPMKQNWK